MQLTRHVQTLREVLELALFTAATAECHEDVDAKPTLHADRRALDGRLGVLVEGWFVEHYRQSNSRSPRNQEFPMSKRPQKAVAHKTIDNYCNPVSKFSRVFPRSDWVILWHDWGGRRLEKFELMCWVTSVCFRIWKLQVVCESFPHPISSRKLWWDWKVVLTDLQFLFQGDLFLHVFLCEQSVPHHRRRVLCWKRQSWRSLREESQADWPSGSSFRHMAGCLDCII